MTRHDFTFQQMQATNPGSKTSADLAGYAEPFVSMTSAVYEWPQAKHAMYDSKKRLTYRT